MPEDESDDVRVMVDDEKKVEDAGLDLLFTLTLTLTLLAGVQWRAATRQLVAIAPPKKNLNPIFTRIIVM